MYTQSTTLHDIIVMLTHHQYGAKLTILTIWSQLNGKEGLFLSLKMKDSAAKNQNDTQIA